MEESYNGINYRFKVTVYSIPVVIIVEYGSCSILTIIIAKGVLKVRKGETESTLEETISMVILVVISFIHIQLILQQGTVERCSFLWWDTIGDITITFRSIVIRISKFGRLRFNSVK